MNLETKHESGHLPIGVLLLALGALALLGQAGLFRSLGSLMGALLFGAAGLYLIRRHRRGRDGLWALCTGFGLLGLGTAAITGPLSGTAFLGITGLGFLVAYRESSERWWALIPAGVLFTLALVAGLDRLAPPLAAGPVFFLGVAAIFWYLYRNSGESRRWAVYPAVALGALALLSLSAGAGWLLPLALIAAGIYFMNRQRTQEAAWRTDAGTLGQRLEDLAASAEKAIRNFAGKASDAASPAGESAKTAGAAAASGAAVGEATDVTPDPHESGGAGPVGDREHAEEGGQAADEPRTTA
jgi:hypothetical protein